MDHRSPNYFFAFLIIALPIVAASFIMLIHLQEEDSLFSDPILFLAQASAPSTSGLIAHWKFDESSGTGASDSSGNGNNGTLTNGPTWATGKINGALSFDGVNDYVIVASSATSMDDMPAITVSAWIKPSSNGENGDGRIVM
ncbi:MAG: hypothetical protein Q8Q41_04315, partial [bacterium]|nr:hypothetical protein [bacterium]